MKEKYRVQMDSEMENTINVFNKEGSYIEFVCVSNRLYCINLDDNGGYVNYLTTISEQKDHFSDVDNKKVCFSKYIQECLYLPLDKDFSGTIDTGGIKECGVDKRHIKSASIILGPTKAAIEGNTVQQTNKVQRDSGLIIHIPPSIITRYGITTLGIDVMHINKCSYTLAVSRHIKFFQCMGTRKKSVGTFMGIIQKNEDQLPAPGF